MIFNDPANLKMWNINKKKVRLTGGVIRANRKQYTKTGANFLRTPLFTEHLRWLIYLK